ncbi:MAG: hypothetical protein QXP04_00295 [Candidatus Nanoarchaeia archaeon]|nr:hypothetical protein [Candidatus Jingweiarchaeum tengchongense]
MNGRIVLIILLIFTLLFGTFILFNYSKELTETTSSTTTPSKKWVLLRAVTEDRRIITNAQIMLDGKIVGEGQVNITDISFGSHRVSFQPVVGYTTPDDIVFAYWGTESIVIEGIYVKEGVKTYVVTVKVLEKNLYTGDITPVRGIKVHVKGVDDRIIKSSEPTDLNGETRISLPQGTYTLYCERLMDGLQTASKTITLSSDMTVELYFYVVPYLSIMDNAAITINDMIFLIAIILVVAFVYRYLRKGGKV